MPMAIRGLLSVPYRLVGIKPSQMHPNLCTICENQFTKVKKDKQITIDATIFFADLRGYTSLSEEFDSSQLLPLLHCFYDACSVAVWERDGIINKFIGDAALAIFNFPLEREDHVRRAVGVAVELQQACGQIRESVDFPEVAQRLGVGIGLHTGKTSIGEVGTAYKDFTAIGPVVNLASRLQNAARAGEVLLSQATYEVVRADYPHAERRLLTLKGIDDPVEAYVPI